MSLSPSVVLNFYARGPLPYKDKKKDTECKLRHMRNNPEYYRLKRREHRARVREYIREIKENSSCAVCGESHVACLVFHHVDSSDKDGNIASAMTNGWSISRVKKELEKCQILCANCHMKHHFSAEI